MAESNLDKFPFVAVPDAVHDCVVGWEKIAADLQRAIAKHRSEKPILVVDTYPGVDELAVLNEFQSRLEPKLAIHAADAYHLPEKIDKLVEPLLRGGNSPSQLADCAPEPPGARSTPSPPRSGGEGRGEVAPRAHGETFPRPSTLDPLSDRSRLSLVNFFNAEPLWRFRRTIDELKGGLVLIVGCGASLIAWGHILVYADLTRRAARQRLRSNEIENLGADKSLPADLKYERALFVDWPVTDRWKRPLIKRWDYLLDTNNPSEPKLADAEDVRRGLHAAARRPFRLVVAQASSPAGSRTVPVQESGGETPPEPAAGSAALRPHSRKGQSTKEDCDPDREAKNSGWGFARVLEENSLLLGFRDVRLELPAIDLLYNQPLALLGEAVHARFGDEFPIRFDFLEKKNLVDRFEPLGSGDGWREERAVLHKGECVDLRRHWFSKNVAHDTLGGVNVLNLVEGDEAIIESPDGAFEPFVVHHAETFIVPAAVGRYNIRPHGPSAERQIATIKAFPNIR